MKKIDKLLEHTKGKSADAYVDYDYGRLTTEELKELIEDDITQERIMEILEPVRFINTDPYSIRKRFERLSTEELEKLTDFYTRIGSDDEQDR